MKKKTRAEWADLVVGVAVIGLCLGFYAFTNATHVRGPSGGIAAAGFPLSRR